MPERVTDGAISPDGAWVALRTNTALYFYTLTDFAAGNWNRRGVVPLADLHEPQGEGVAFADNSTLYVVGEGGGRSKGGTFARLTCTF